MKIKRVSLSIEDDVSLMTGYTTVRIDVFTDGECLSSRVVEERSDFESRFDMWVDKAKQLVMEEYRKEFAK